jgi:hypothetical protein
MRRTAIPGVRDPVELGQEYGRRIPVRAVAFGCDDREDRPRSPPSTAAIRTRLIDTVAGQANGQRRKPEDHLRHCLLQLAEVIDDTEDSLLTFTSIPTVTADRGRAFLG